MSLPPLPLMRSCPPRAAMQSAFSVPLITSSLVVPMITFRPLALHAATGSTGVTVTPDAPVPVDSSARGSAAEQPLAIATTPRTQARIAFDDMVSLPCWPPRPVTRRHPRRATPNRCAGRILTHHHVVAETL